MTTILKRNFFPRNSEAERKNFIFAQSLATPMPEPLPVDNMPTFTVLLLIIRKRFCYL